MKNLSFVLLLFTFLCCCKSQPEVTPDTALESYLENNDPSFSWELKESYKLNGPEVYNLLVTSQKWRNYTWRHQLAVVVPEEINYDGALLFITGGSTKDEMPNWKSRDDKTLHWMQQVAQKNRAVVAVLYQVPNQPLFGNLTEDEIISLTFHNYRDDHDFTWPLLFPMVKSAIRAMDALQAFSQETLNHKINRFMVSGASKRGWTTWLTAATDPRVEAIAPMVIDMLNMPKSISYHLEAWNDYSIQIEDYVKLGIAQDVNTPEGQELTTMVDPYSYRDKLTMPKLIFNGTNDEYWPADAIKHYLGEIPGENYLHYVPNAGHGLGDKKQAMQALSSFYGQTLRKMDYPKCTWSITENSRGVELRVQTSPEKLAGALLWSSDSEDRDFRDNTFVKETLQTTTGEEVKVIIPYPASGFRAFYVDLLYTDPNGDIYSISTRMFVIDTNKVL